MSNKQSVQQEELAAASTQKQSEINKTNSLLFILTTLLLMVGCCVFSVLCLNNSGNGYIGANATLLSILAGVVLNVFFGICVWSILTGRDSFFKTCFSAFVLLLFCLVLLFVLLKTGFFDVIKSESSLQEYLANKGAWMPVFYIVLQYLQVVILPIPSTVSTLAGVALFGPFKTLIYSLIGIMLGSLTAFFIGRKLGHKTVAWLVGKDTLHKWQEKLRGKDNLLLTMMFVLPVFPDDVLCFVAGLSSMSTRYFVIMLTIARILAISVTCYSIDLIPFNTWWGLLIWVVFFALVIGAFVIVYKNLDKIQAWLSKKFSAFQKKK